MKLKRVLYVVPLLLFSGVFFFGIARFKKGRKSQATRELMYLCVSIGRSDRGWNPSVAGQVADLLQRGADANVLTPYGDSILWIVGRHPNKTSVQVLPLLIRAGAKIDARGKDSSTALMHVAAERSSEALSCVHIFLAHGADANSRDLNADTVLHYAARGSHIEAAQMLLDRGAKIDAENRDGATPLFEALSVLVEYPENATHCARLLLDHGANPQHLNKKGQTPLFVALQQLKQAEEPDVVGNVHINKSISRAITMLQNAIRQRKRVKSPRT